MYFKNPIEYCTIHRIVIKQKYNTIHLVNKWGLNKLMLVLKSEFSNENYTNF